MNHTVITVRDNDLCISCGICVAVCPHKCIELSHINGMNLPAINFDRCVGCNKCFEACPGKGFNYRERGETYTENFGLGNAKEFYTAKTKDENVLMNATSGGVATEIISHLLNDGEYENAFVIRGHIYCSDVVSTEMISRDSNLYDSQKSRYLIVSHTKCIEYILAHRAAKLILIGTSCFVHGILNLISMYGLERKNYFIIGLFCDRTMSMNVIEYFRKHKAITHGLKEFFFRTKDAGPVKGWPGGVRIVEDDSNVIDLPNTERMRVKDYFQPERCLYCLDKLNMFADISIGDNYTSKHSDRCGSSSVIIRTEEGVRVWKKYETIFDVFASCEEDIFRSQHLEERRNNYFFSEIKSKMINSVINDIPVDYELIYGAGILRTYSEKLKRIRIGKNYMNSPNAIIRSMRIYKFKLIIKRCLQKIFRLLFMNR